MSMIASVSSSKGGSGKSTTSINLGVALSKLGREVTVVDGNLATPYLSMYLGAPKVDVTLHHVLSGSAHMKEAVYKHSSGMKIVPGCLEGHDGFDNLKLDSLKDYISHLDSDIVLVDGAPGLDEESKAAMKLSSEVLTVTTTELPSVAHSVKTIRLAEKLGKKIAGVVLTRAGHGSDVKTENVETILNRPVVGIIPEDGHMKHALMKREPVTSAYPKAPAALAYMDLANYFLSNSHDQRMRNYISKRQTGAKILNWALGMKD